MNSSSNIVKFLSIAVTCDLTPNVNRLKLLNNICPLRSLTIRYLAINTIALYQKVPLSTDNNITLILLINENISEQVSTLEGFASCISFANSAVQ